MTLKFNLQDPLNKIRAKLAQNRSLSVHVVERGLPLTGTPNTFRYFSELLKDSNDVTNQAVDGSTDPQEFALLADKDADIHIQAITIIVTDTSISHDKFGALNALANGVDSFANESGEKVDILTKAKSTGEIIFNLGAFWPYGNNSLVWVVNKITPTIDAMMYTYPIYEFLPEGIRLGRGTVDRLASIINDDISAINSYTIRAVGYKHFPVDEVERKQ